MPATQPQQASTLEWLTQLYAHHDGHLAAFALDRTTGDRRTAWGHTGDLASFSTALADLEPTCCVWLGAATRTQRTRGRGTAADCDTIPGLWVDIDIAGPGHHQGGQLATDLHHAHTIANAFPLPPTAVVATGGGLQAWWLFAEPIHLADQPGLLAAWGHTWDEIGARHNVDLDNVWDPARVMRVPGTTNRKEGGARPVEVVTADWGRRYGVDDIDQHLAAPPPAPTHRSATAIPYIGPERPGDAYNLRHTGGDILARHGFTLTRTDRSGDEHWTRPGKEAREGTSATVYGDDGHTTIWSDTVRTMWPAIEVRRPYDPFGLVTCLEHRGDHRAATQALRAAGYGHTAAPTTTNGVVIEDQPEEWDEPRDFPEPAVGPPFPIEVLPSWVQRHVIDAAGQVQVPVDLTAVLAIGALSAACTGRARVHVSANWTEPVNLYLVVALRSGVGKSPAEKLMVAWLRTWQRDQIAAVMGDYEKAKLRVRHSKKKLAKLEGGMGEDADLFRAMDDVTKAEADVPTLPRLLADDASPEAVATLLRDHGERLAILSTEADLFDMLLKGKPGQRQNMNIYLKAWSGDSFIRDRKGGSESGPEWTELANPLLTCSVTVQPSVLARLYGDDEMVGRGFASRFMVSAPRDFIGRRNQAKRFEDTRLPGAHSYDEEATRLASKWSRWARPADLRISTGARDTLQAFLVETEPTLAAGGENERLAEWANKLYASVARYAGLLHLAEDGDTQAEINADTMARAVALGRYWMGHATAIGATTDHIEAQATAILGWVAEVGEFSLAQLQAGLRRPGIGLDLAADYVPALEALVGLGWLRPLAEGDWRSSVGVRRSQSPRFAPWPGMCGKPLSAFYPRSPRTAYMGECFSPLPPLPPHPPLDGTRYADYADNAIEAEIHNRPKTHADYADNADGIAAALVETIAIDPDEDLFT